MNKIIFWIQMLPGSVISNIWIAGWVVVALYMCIGMLGSMLVYRKAKYLMMLGVIMTLLGVYRITTLSVKNQEHRIVIYHANKQSLIDFQDGGNVVSLSDTMPRRKEIFTAQANRIRHAIREKTVVFFAADTSFFQGNLLIDKPFVRFFETNLVIIDDPVLLSTNSVGIPTDVLLLRKNPKVTIADCRKHFPFQIVVFDASNSQRQTERWIKECKAEGWNYHDVRSRGAWEMEE